MLDTCQALKQSVAMRDSLMAPGNLVAPVDVFAAVLLQIVMVLIAITLFSYVRSVYGERARFISYLRMGYAVLGATYIVGGITTLLFPIDDMIVTKPEALFRVIDSSLSLGNSLLFAIAWYLMRDLRLERETDPHGAMPSMSKRFAGGVIMVFVTTLASFLAMVNDLMTNEILRLFFIGIDVMIGASVLVLLGFEFSKMSLIHDAEEGSLFASKQTHLVFRRFTFALFLLWGVGQVGYFLYELLPALRQLSFLKYPEGGLYTWLAVIKILAAGTATVLAQHGLPVERWKHKKPVKPRKN